jgi:hypothetical protein
MTPQEKAEDLLLKYSILKDGQNDLVKKCALIAVDEILKDREEIDGIRVINDPYWMEVRNEIEKL